MSSEAQRRATAKYQRSLTSLQFKLNPNIDSDVIDYWKSQENMRRKFIEVTRELIEKERQ